MAEYEVMKGLGIYLGIIICMMTTLLAVIMYKTGGTMFSNITSLGVGVGGNMIGISMIAYGLKK